MNTDFFDFQIFATLEPENLLQQCFGNNEKQLLIITKKSEEDVELWDLLQKILGAVKHDLKNDASHLLVQPNQQFSLADLYKNREIKRVVSFRVAPKTMGLNFNVTPYQILEFDNRAYLFVHPLTSIAGKPALKKQLWEALKVMFA